LFAFAIENKKQVYCDEIPYVIVEQQWKNDAGQTYMLKVLLSLKKLVKMSVAVQSSMEKFNI
jgi:hypothetical protein